MNRCHVAVVVGSLRRDSMNQKLADAVIGLAPPDLSFVQVTIGNLPCTTRMTTRDRRRRSSD